MPSDQDKTNGKVTFTLTSAANGNCFPVFSQVTITIVPAPVVQTMADMYVIQNQSVVLKPDVSGTNLQYSWSPALYLNNSTAKNPVFTAKEDVTYTLTVTGTAGCVATTQLHINVLKPVRPPNTFTPNGDGINDTWVINELSKYPGTTVKIFNRYGAQLFYSDGYGKAWDGTYRGQPLPLGVYYYLIDLKSFGGIMSGYVTIIR